MLSGGGHEFEAVAAGEFAQLRKFLLLFGRHGADLDEEILKNRPV